MKTLYNLGQTEEGREILLMFNPLLLSFLFGPPAQFFLKILLAYQIHPTPPYPSLPPSISTASIGNGISALNTADGQGCTVHCSFVKYAILSIAIYNLRGEVEYSGVYTTMHYTSSRAAGAALAPFRKSCLVFFTC